MIMHYCGEEACQCKEAGKPPDADSDDYCSTFDFVILLIWNRDDPTQFITEHQNVTQWYNHLEALGAVDSSQCKKGASSSSSSSSRRLSESSKRGRGDKMLRTRRQETAARRQATAALEKKRARRRERSEPAASSSGLRADATESELRHFFEQTAGLTEYAPRLAETRGVMNARALFLLAPDAGAWETVRHSLFDGDAAAANLLRFAVLAALADHENEHEMDAPPMRDQSRFSHRKLTSTGGKYGALYLNVYDTSDSSENFINRQFLEFAHGNCAANTYFDAQMAGLANKPPEKLVAEFYNCFPSRGGAVQAAIGIAVANTAMVEEVAIALSVIAILLIAKKVLKKDMVSFKDSDIEDKLYDMAYDQLLVEHNVKKLKDEEKKKLST